ncbi:hypothetical protein M2651_10425 [Clostridium sp. SYSU_GA19001]|nr:hypothetical protein [Clostridium caldaquaticum]MCM8711435.1 hypothetical protein [Clostridium caldaquaticum]
MRRRNRMMPSLGKMALLGLGVGAYMMFNKNDKNQGNNTNNENSNQNNNG